MADFKFFFLKRREKRKIRGDVAGGTASVRMIFFIKVSSII